MCIRDTRRNLEEIMVFKQLQFAKRALCVVLAGVLLLASPQTTSVNATEPAGETFHDWDSYETSYVYDQLPSNMQRYWDYLDSYFDELLTTTADYHASVVTDTASYNGVRPQYLMEKLEVPDYMTDEEMEKLFYVYDKSKYYFVLQLMKKVYPDPYGQIQKDFYIYFYPEFRDGDTRMTYTKKYNAKLNEIRAAANENCSSDYEKMKYIYDYICKKCDYNDALIRYCDGGYMPGNFGRSAAGVFEEQSIVCQAYANAYSLILNSMGYDVVSVTNRNHAWNKVKLDGVWYVADATSDDKDYFDEDTKHWYFLIPESKHFSIKEETSVAAYFPDATTEYVVNNCEVHDWDTLDSFAGSCSEMRWELRVCKLCGFREKSFWAALGHDYQITEEVESAEGVVGHKTYTCSRCEDSYTEYDESHEHVYVQTEVVTADCTSGGYDKYECSGCGDVKFENRVSALGHDYQPFQYLAPTCMEAGSENEKCSRCGDVTELRTIAALGHSYAFDHTVAPTCTDDGYDVYLCRCGGEEHRNIVTASHTEVFKETVAPTCQERGYDKYECSVCNEIIKKNYVATVAHNYVVKTTVAPTCLVAGYTVYECSMCQDTKNDDPVTALGHDFVFTRTVGYTCTDDGYDLYDCSRCTADEHRNIVPAQHDFSFNSTVAANCQHGGYDVYKCDNCTEVEHRNETAATAHHYSVFNVVAPTCVMDGYTVYKCDDCVATKREDETEKLGHDFVFTRTVGYTCTDDGYDLYDCSRCTADEHRNIVAAHHDYSFDSTVAPTCTTEGYDLYECDNCTSTEHRNAVAKISHNFVAETVVDGSSAAGCTTTYTCIACSGVYSREYLIQNGYDVPVASAPAAIEASVVTAIVGSMTPSESTEYLSGADITIEIRNSTIAEAMVPVAEKDALDDIKGNKTIGMYVDFTLQVKVGTQPARQLSEPDAKVTVSFVLPAQLRPLGGNYVRNYSVLHIHTGDPAEVLQATYNSLTGEISFETTRFSTFAIAYEDVYVAPPVVPIAPSAPNVAPKDIVPKTGETAQNSYWMMLMLLSVVGIALVFAKKSSKNS